MDISYPWEAPTHCTPEGVSVEVMETPEEAARRHGVRARKMSAQSRRMGLLPKRVPTGTLAMLAPRQWDQVAAACIAMRKPNGPKPGLSERRAGPDRESASAASKRLRVNRLSLLWRVRQAKIATMHGLPAAQWTELAKGLPRRAR